MVNENRYELTYTGDKIQSILTKADKIKEPIGELRYFNSNIVPDYCIKPQGQSLDRAVDNLLYEFALASGQMIEQSLKDSDPDKYAMKWGTGNGTSTFTCPNFYLGHFVRANPAGVEICDTQDSQNKEHTHDVAQAGSSGTGAYAMRSTSFSGYMTTEKEGGDEARPKTANLLVCIYRGNYD